MFVLLLVEEKEHDLKLYERWIEMYHLGTRACTSRKYKKIQKVTLGLSLGYQRSVKSLENSQNLANMRF